MRMALFDRPIPASLIGQGVTKSGSPTPNEITWSIEAMMSKKRLMPEPGTACTRSATRAAPSAVPIVCAAAADPAPAAPVRLGSSSLEYERSLDAIGMAELALNSFLLLRGG